jgi:molecular chaperone HscA
VGGSTRMPQVRRAVAQLFGRPPLVKLNPDEVVALGAAMQADQLAGNSGGDGQLLLDVIPLSLGLETMGGLVERIVPRNQTIPTAMAQDFTTYKDGQTALALHVVQGERDLVQDCRSLARFELRGIPPMAAGAARIRVSFTVDADGLLSVAAREQTSGVEARVDVKPSYGLSDEEIARMLKESFTTAEVDMVARALAEARVDAERLALATESALAMDGDLLDEEERSRIEALIVGLRAAVTSGADAATVEAATKALARGTESFAAQRMNRGIRQVLAGRNVETL